jgi:GTPase Era involved in 16S rRNA processing
VDTPGLFLTTDDLETTLDEVTLGVSLSLPGPHVILYVIRGDVVFTEEDEASFNKILEVRILSVVVR